MVRDKYNIIEGEGIKSPSMPLFRNMQSFAGE